MRCQPWTADAGKFVVDARDYRHNVLRVTLKNGETYALDMMGAQYGWYGSVVMPWSLFCDERVEVIKEVRKFGQTAQVLKAQAQAAGVPLSLVHQITEGVEEGFTHHMREWQRSTMSFKAMLRLSEEDFRMKQDSLIKFMEEAMSAYKALSIKWNCFNIWKDKK